MNFVVSPGGLVVHSRMDWPCAVCRPGDITESPGYCLCLDCANSMMVAAGVGEEGARALLDELTDALGLLVAQTTERRVAAN
jgi:hypothetical protein